MRIFFDLDGTLVDASDRLFRLFQFLAPVSNLNKEHYWKMKRNKFSHRQILKELFQFTDQQIDSFENTWLSMIELPEWIAFDKPFERITPYLINLKKNHSLYIVTARQLEHTAIEQVHRYEWSDIFSDILVTGHRCKKAELINKRVVTSREDWLVGDTGKDIEAGKQLGLRTAAVTSGFLNLEKLLEYSPDMVANNVIDLKFKN